MLGDIAIRVPRDGEPRPFRTVTVPDIDTGGGFRAAFRAQNPNTDPAEPGGGESSSVGTDHGWANCTMSAGAMAYAYEDHDAAPWGGHMRHSQDDMSGGTDLNDLRTAWQRYGGKSLTIKSGTGWDDVVKAHDEGRAVVIQGEGDCPGNGDFTGAHACCIAPETDSNGNWLWGDPDTSGWQWVTPGSIKSWAERLNTSICFAVSQVAGDSAMADIPVIDPTPKLCDVSEGVQLYDLGTISPHLRMPQTRTGMRVLFSTESASGTIMRAVLYTRPDPDPDLVLAVYNADARNLRAVDDGGDSSADEEEIIAQRDAEWIAHLTPD